MAYVHKDGPHQRACKGCHGFARNREIHRLAPSKSHVLEPLPIDPEQIEEIMKV